MEGTEEQSNEESPQNRRKRSLKSDSKPLKNLENESTALTIQPLETESTKFNMLLSNATLLAKVTSDFTLLQDQIKNVVLNGITTDLNKDQTVLSSVFGKIKRI